MPLRDPPLHLRDQLIENWFNDVLAFANLENADDVHILFGVDAQRDWVENEESSEIDVLYNFIGSPETDGYADSQVRLREVLNTLTAHGETSEVEQLISDAIDRISVQSEITFRAGYLRFQSTAHVHSHNQWWAVGIATLIHAGMSDRVRQCGWDNCTTYFVDWPGRKGQRKHYCSVAHQNAEGQRRYRERAKRNRRQ
jgi:predicted RNA-binding Zn ribbon-like protein